MTSRFLTYCTLALARTSLAACLSLQSLSAGLGNPRFFLSSPLFPSHTQEARSALQLQPRMASPTGGHFRYERAEEKKGPKPRPRANINDVRALFTVEQPQKKQVSIQYTHKTFSNLKCTPLNFAKGSSIFPFLTVTFRGRVRGLLLYKEQSGFHNITPYKMK